VIPVQAEVSKLKLVKRLRVKLKLTEGVNERENEGVNEAVNEGLDPVNEGPAVGREIVGPGAVGRLIAGGLGRGGPLPRPGGPPPPVLGGGLGLFPPPSPRFSIRVAVKSCPLATAT